MLLARGVDLDARNQEGMTPLSMAAENSHEGCVLALIRDGANINSRDNLDKILLHLASKKGNLDLLNLLLARGISIDAQDYHKVAALSTAIDGRPGACVLALIQHGVDINCKGTTGLTALHIASESGDLGMLEILLQARVVELDARNDRGETPLFIAAQSSNEDCVLALVRRGADVNAQDENGIPALHLASAYGSVKSTAALAEHSATFGMRSNAMCSVKHNKSRGVHSEATC